MSYEEDLKRVNDEISMYKAKIEEETGIVDALEAQATEIKTKLEQEQTNVNAEQLDKLNLAEQKLQEDIDLLIAKQTKVAEKIKELTPE